LSSIYTEWLIMNGDLTAVEAEALTSRFENKLQAALEEVKTGPAEYPTMGGFEGHWKGLTPPYSHAPVETGVAEEQWRYIAGGCLRVPENFLIHPKIVPIFQGWNRDLREHKPLFWPFAELLAFGSLVLEGVPVRLSGQDSRRGTFSQRHAVLYDARSGEPF